MHISVFYCLYCFFCSGLAFNLTILHTNDVHARLQSFDFAGRECAFDDKTTSEQKCFGGAAKLMTAVQKLRQEHKNLLLLDAGDQYVGTAWFSFFKHEPAASAMNLISYDAMAFGNHEFDFGLKGLLPFLKKLKFPIVNSNIDSMGTDLEHLYDEYLIVHIDGRKVGIIGYTTPDTVKMAYPDPKMVFHDEVPALRRAVQHLKNAQDAKGLDIIIAVGHSGILTDRKICKEVEDIDIVIGGHTNTFLYSGQPPAKEKPKGPYPEVYRVFNKPCLVVTDYAYGKYLGFLQAVFDDSGVLKSWSGNPILLDNRFAENEEMREVLKPFAEKLAEKQKEVVGSTSVELDSENYICRLQECSVGNLVTDAAIFAFEQLRKHSGQEARPMTKVAIMNSGGIKDFFASPGENITIADVMQALPFQDSFELASISGRVLKEVFEHSVEDYSLEARYGKFLQVSGVKVVYDLAKPNGDRVIGLKLLCSECLKDEYEKVIPNNVYQVLLRGYVKRGKDGYSMIPENDVEFESTPAYAEVPEQEALSQYLKQKSPINVIIDERIQLMNAPVNAAGKTINSIFASLLAVTLALIHVWRIAL